MMFAWIFLMALGLIGATMAIGSICYEAFWWPKCRCGGRTIRYPLAGEVGGWFGTKCPKCKRIGVVYKGNI